MGDSTTPATTTEKNWFHLQWSGAISSGKKTSLWNIQSVDEHHHPSFTNNNVQYSVERIARGQGAKSKFLLWNTQTKEGVPQLQAYMYPHAMEYHIWTSTPVSPKQKPSGTVQNTKCYEWIKLPAADTKSGAYHVYVFHEEQHKFTRDYKVSLDMATRSFALREGQVRTKDKPVVARLEQGKSNIGKSNLFVAPHMMDNNMMLISLCLAILSRELSGQSQMTVALSTSYS